MFSVVLPARRKRSLKKERVLLNEDSLYETYSENDTPLEYINIRVVLFLYNNCLKNV